MSFFRPPCQFTIRLQNNKDFLTKQAYDEMECTTPPLHLNPFNIEQGVSHMTREKNLHKRIRVHKIHRPSIAVMSLADKVKGQGVGSAYVEQLALIKERMGGTYEIRVNGLRSGDVTHYHSINLRFFFHALLHRKSTVKIGAVHFIPETLEGSIKLPGWMKRIFYRYILAFYGLMDVLVTVNPVFIDKLVALGFDRDRIHYIPNFVSEKQFHKLTQTERLASRTRYGLPEDRFTVLGVGQVQTRKGILDFVDVAECLPEIQFVWAGGFSFGKITDGYDTLKEIVENPPANVRFIGIVDRADMNALYNMADLMFLPSYSELFPMTVLESMQVGTPMLLRDLDLYKVILFDYYLSADSNETFAAHIHKLATDTVTHTHWTNQSLIGGKRYTRQTVGDDWQKFYEEAMQMKTGANDLRKLKKIFAK